MTQASYVHGLGNGRALSVFAVDPALD